jgi:multiple sugar transport system permease protein
MVTGVNAQDLMFLREPILACGCLITIFPLIILYLIAQRYFTEGVERSGIVG